MDWVFAESRVWTSSQNRLTIVINIYIYTYSKSKYIYNYIYIILYIYILYKSNFRVDKTIHWPWMWSDVLYGRGFADTIWGNVGTWRNRTKGLIHVDSLLSNLGWSLFEKFSSTRYLQRHVRNYKETSISTLLEKSTVPARSNGDLIQHTNA